MREKAVNFGAKIQIFQQNCNDKKVSKIEIKYCLVIFKKDGKFTQHLKARLWDFFEDFATLCPFFKCMSFDVQRVTLKTVEAGLDFLRGSSS